MNIILTADSSCDLPSHIVKDFPFHLFPLGIIQNEVIYTDGVDICPDDIYKRVAEGLPLPTTAAVNMVDYYEGFSKLSKDYDAVIHISISSELSSCFANARLAAEELPNVYVVDSQNISLGQGSLVLEAHKMVEKGLSPEEIVRELNALVPKVTFAFVLDQLDYLKKGGRCSSMAALGANLLQLKPAITVVDGKLVMMKKYRGAFLKILPTFISDIVSGQKIKDGSLKLLSTKSPVAWTDLAAKELTEQTGVTITEFFTTGCTISSHSGPNVIGVSLIAE